jgi:hypothetical protein
VFEGFDHGFAFANGTRVKVVCSDLRGYGDSDSPPSDADHEPYSKRAMAQDQLDFFLIQPPDLPERLIGADPGFYLRWTLREWAGDRARFAPEALAEYERCFDAATIHASCEDYRAGATIDLAHDRTDADTQIRCPMLVL